MVMFVICVFYSACILLHFHFLFVGKQGCKLGEILLGRQAVGVSSGREIVFSWKIDRSREMYMVQMLYIVDAGSCSFEPTIPA